MKKVIALSLAVAAIFSLSFAPSAEAATTEPIKIGLTTVLTGDRASEGLWASNAARMAIDEINAAGGVLGRPIEIVIEDAQGTDVGAVNAYRKLADDSDIVAIIGSDNSNDNIAISSSVLEAQIMTTAQGANPRLRDLCINENPWMFQLRAVQETMIAATLKYAIEELGFQRFVIINDTETNSAEQALISKDVLESYGIEPIDMISFTTGTKDFSSHIFRIQRANADCIIGTCLWTEAAILTQQIRASGIETPIIGSNGFSDQLAIDVAGESMNGVYSFTAFVPSTPNPIGAAFAQRYLELFNNDSANPAAQVYDHIHIISEAINRAGTTDRTAVRDAMLTITDFKGAITTYDMSRRGSCATGGLLVQIQDLKPVVLQEVFTD